MNNTLEGQGATYQIGSDCYAYTIVKHLSPKRLWACSDKSYQIGDWYSKQDWVISDLATGRVEEFSLRKSGEWRPKGDKCGRLIVGKRMTNLDPNF